MPKFRKKPVVIEATQWFTHGDHPQVDRLDRWRDIAPHLRTCREQYGWVETLEGGHIVSPSDWIIRGVAGELYPCKDAIFRETYEPVDGPDTGLPGNQTVLDAG